MTTDRIGRWIETALIALFAGTVSCVLTATLFVPDPPPLPPTPLVDSSGPPFNEADGVPESLARIETSISDLNTRLTNLGHRREPDADSSTGETLAKILEQLEALGPDPAIRAPETGEGWISATDERLARCLVEHAKTPYDEGVAPLLMLATQELGAAADYFIESRRLLKERNKQRLQAAQRANLDVWTPPKGEQQAVTDAHRTRVEDTLARFRQAIAALDS